MSSGMTRFDEETFMSEIGQRCRRAKSYVYLTRIEAKILKLNVSTPTVIDVPITLFGRPVRIVDDPIVVEQPEPKEPSKSKVRSIVLQEHGIEIVFRDE